MEDDRVEWVDHLQKGHVLLMNNYQRTVSIRAY
jgi:hypothetical protein